MAAYTRPTPTSPLLASDRQQLLRDYHAHYTALAKTAPEALNVKLPRDALAPLLDEIGGRLLDEAERLSREPGPLRTFLDENPLPTSLRPHLPEEFRAFCLVLNSLKQWIAAEQAATDRYLLGGSARKACRAAAETCVVTGEKLGNDAELHHPLRDGRPPILLSKAGHDRIEGQTSGGGARSGASPDAGRDGTVMELIRGVKRNESWKQLRRGCLDQLGQGADRSTSVATQQNARAFASRVKQATGLGFKEILVWMDENGLGANG